MPELPAHAYGQQRLYHLAGKTAVCTRSVGRWRHYAELAPDFFARISEIPANFDP